MKQSERERNRETKREREQVLPGKCGQPANLLRFLHMRETIGELGGTCGGVDCNAAIA